MGGIYIKGLSMPRGEDEGFLIAIFDGFAQKVGTREEFVAYEVVSEMEKTTRWIPVTERLPEQRINQNTLDFEYVLCATTFGDVRPFKYGRRIGQGEAHFWNGAGYVDAYVTHWQSLPTPPKEETE